jgi:hypothetical protein
MSKRVLYYFFCVSLHAISEVVIGRNVKRDKTFITSVNVFDMELR